jgi:trehalose/maltose transport system substrate-binding protein
MNEIVMTPRDYASGNRFPAGPETSGDQGKVLGPGGLQPNQENANFMHSIRGSTCRSAILAVISLILAGMEGCHRPSEQPVTVKLLQQDWVPPDDLPAVEALSEDVAHHVGVKLEMIRGVPSETHDQLSLAKKLLQQQAEGPDVVEIDEPWLGSLKDDLLDLRPYFPDEPGSISQMIESSYIIDGKVLALPYHNQAGALEYRADLLRKYGYDHAPRTWTELETMALRIQKAERAHGKRDFWGYIWPGAVEESLTCNALEWQVDEGGGHIIEGDGTISVDNPAAIRAWERAKRWIGWISPPSVTEYRETDVKNAFQTGRTAFVRVWVGEAGVLATRPRPGLRAVNWWNPPQVGEAGFAVMPAGSVAHVAVLGGAGVAISRYSRHPQEDAALVRFLLRKELESFREKSHSLQWVIYDAPDADKSRAVVVTRPTNISAPNYEEVSTAYSSAVHSVLTGEKKASDAASKLEKELVGITGLHARLPTAE